MQPSAIAGTALRSAAVVIALVAAVDPTITSARTGKPSVVVIATDSPRDSALAERVAGALSKQFTVFRTPYSKADGAVLVGDGLSAHASELPAPTFAVHSEPGVSLSSVHAPSAAPAGSRVSVDVVAHVAGQRGRALDVTLRAGGLVVDRVKHTVSTDDERVPLMLTYVPPASGAASLRVSASITGSADTAATDIAVDVRDQRWAVLFFDARPSWMSTFVRRAVERDPRFVVTSRVVTSRNLSTDAGQPPRLADLAALQLFEAVVVGAPESLNESDVAGLDAFMRRRGGSVVLLLDRRAAGAYERLAPIESWVTDSGSRTMSVVPIAGDTVGLRASELAYPRRLPSAAIALARTEGARVDSANGRAVIWRAPVGAGRVIVSGALDSWRYRDRGVSGFDRFWQTAIADASGASPPAVALSISRPVVRPGENTDVNVTVRDAALSSAAVPRTSLVARLESDTAGPAAVRLWPTGVPGQFTGTLSAPTATGTYRVVVDADGARGVTPLVVSRDAMHATPDDRDLLDAWVRARGGRSVSSSRVDELSAALAAAIRPAPRMETWHVMRSAWWILPFALALSAEWWMRRRRGLK